VIRQLKLTALDLLQRFGVSTRVMVSSWRHQRLLILCYHGVSLADEHEWFPGLYVSPAHLQQRLVSLQRLHCNVLPLGEAVRRLYAGNLPPRSVALTFDDGYFDFQARALPVLRQFGYPATVYLTTGRVDRNLPNVNLSMSYAVWRSKHERFDGRGIPGLGGEFRLGDAAERQQLVQRIIDALNGEHSAEHRRDDVVRTVVERAGLDYEDFVASRILTLLRPDEVGVLARQGVDFQLHTHQHRTPEDPQEFMKDLLFNRERLHDMTGQWATHFCYPSGNYRTEYPAHLRRCGIESATTCDPGIAASHDDPLLLPRFVDTSGVSPLVFESWVTGVAARLPRRTIRGGTRMTGHYIVTGTRGSTSPSPAVTRE
jgi:peptidoglycan/xylan/chitin deacetylase (PgdA/CDA1 family)